MPKTICVDFDGVIHSYTSGWEGADTVSDPPVRGAFEWLGHLIDDEFEVCIYSSRSRQPGGVEAMQDWFRCNLPLGKRDYSWILGHLKFPTEKPAAMMTVDDRAFCFEGDFPSVGWLNRFVPWTRRGVKP